MPISASVASSAQSSTTTATFLIRSLNALGNFLMALSTSLSNSTGVVRRRFLEALRTSADEVATQGARTVVVRRAADDSSVSGRADGVGGALRGPERKGPTGGWVE